MKITKLVHSCLLIEKDDKRVLADPGDYSWASGLITPEILSNLDAICITHEHPDHFDENFCRAILAASPNAVWLAPSGVGERLKALGIEKLVDQTDFISVETSEHADLEPLGERPEHQSYLILRELLLSGDCQTHTSLAGARVLAGPINGGPWGALMGELRMVNRLDKKPEVFIPLHDWHWRDEARESLYTMLTGYFSENGMRFIATKSGETYEV